MALFGTAQPLLTALTGAHAEACAALHGTVFAQGWSALEFESLMAAPVTLGDAALDPRSGVLAGFALSRGAAGEAEIITIAVAADWRRRGLGTRLLDRHLRHLALAGCAAVFLEVGAGNEAARRLYAAAGFVEVGRRKAYYAPKPGLAREDALVLRRALQEPG